MQRIEGRCGFPVEAANSRLARASALTDLLSAVSMRACIAARSLSMAGRRSSQCPRLMG